MGSADSGGPPQSRRAFLGGTAGLLGGLALPSLGASSPDLTVMTRNLYVGADLFELYRAGSVAELRQIAGDLLETILGHPFSARMDAIADEIAATRPDVIGIQEGAVVRTQQPSDFSINPFPNASEVVVDLLELLGARLSARGLGYEVAAATVTSDIEIPADVGGHGIDVRLTDRTAILVRDGLEVNDTRAGTFDAARSISAAGLTVLTLRRGYCLAELTTAGIRTVVATTHLESADADIRLRQARELLERLPTDRPLVLAGDLNSGPELSPAAYDRLTRSFTDTHTALEVESPGGTCCHDADLRNEDAQLASRIDAILYRGGLEPTAIQRVGTDPADRAVIERDGETIPLWPSDHAGVVATFEPVTEDNRPVTGAVQRGGSPTRSPPPDVALDGFGPAAAVAAILLGGLVQRYRRNR